MYACWKLAVIFQTEYHHQVFRKVNIGTAKVEAEICEQVPHHLLDVANIGEVFSAGNYRTLAEQAVQVTTVMCMLCRLDKSH